MNRNYSSFDREITLNDITEYRKNNSNTSLTEVVGNELILALGTILVIMALTFFGPIASFSTVVLLAATALWGLTFVACIAAIRQIYRTEMNIRVRLDHFAKDNGMNYSASSRSRDESGMIFGIGSERLSYHILRNNIDDQFEIGNHRYTTGSGKNKRTIESGYLMIHLDRNLPHIVLDSKRNNFNFLGASMSNLPVSFKKDQILKLEGDFNSYFTLYAPKEYETDALYVFNPLLMALFIDQAGDFDAEIVDDKLYVYSKNPFKFDDKNTLQRIFNIIDTAMKKTADGVKRYSDESVGSFSSNVVNSGGQRLRRNLRLTTVLFVILIALFYFVDFLMG